MATNKALFFISESCSPQSHKLTSAVTFAHTASALRNASTAADVEAPHEEAEPAIVTITRVRNGSAGTPNTVHGFSPSSSSAAPSPSSTPASSAVSQANSNSSNGDLFQKRNPTIESRPSLLSRQLAALRTSQQLSQAAPPVPSPGAARKQHRSVEPDIYIASSPIMSGSSSHHHVPPPPAPPAGPLLDCSESLKRHIVTERQGVFSQLQRRIGNAVSAEAQVPIFSYKPPTTIGW